MSADRKVSGKGRSVLLKSMALAPFLIGFAAACGDGEEHAAITPLAPTATKTASSSTPTETLSTATPVNERQRILSEALPKGQAVLFVTIASAPPNIQIIVKMERADPGFENTGSAIRFNVPSSGINENNQPTSYLIGSSCKGTYKISTSGDGKNFTPIEFFAEGGKTTTEFRFDPERCFHHLSLQPESKPLVH